MSEILVVAMRVGMLVVLWLFVLLVANVIRRDMFGRAMPVAELERAQAGLAAPVKPKKQKGKAGAGVPRALKVIEGRQVGLEIPLTQRVTIGRGADCALVIDDDYASTHHCSIIAHPRGPLYVEDSGSTNGTYVNEARITQPTSFGLDDTLRIGRTIMRLVT